jgi:formyl-CoA transferase
VPLTDLGAGLFTLVGILAAVHCRTQIGIGQHVDTSLVEAGIALSIWEATEYFSSGGIPAPLGSAHRMNAPYQAIRCADGYITIGANNDRLFRRLYESLGRPEWADEPDFADNPSRVRNRAALAARIEEITARQPRRHWLTLLDENDIPCGPINNYAEVFADPQVIAREMVVEIDHPVLGHLKTLGSPIKLSATPPNPHRRAPLLGEHTDEVLRQAGYSAVEIQALRQAGAIR